MHRLQASKDQPYAEGLLLLTYMLGAEKALMVRGSHPAGARSHCRT
jgi:hypothetical protein